MSDSNPLDAFRLFRLNLKSDWPYWLDEPIESIDSLFIRMKEAENEWAVWHRQWREEDVARRPIDDSYSCVKIQGPHCQELWVGLASARWFVRHFETDEQGRPFRLLTYSLGDGNPEVLLEFHAPDGFVVFEHQLIPAEAGRQVVKTWLETGQLWDQVDWEIASQVVWEDPFEPGGDCT